GSWGKGNDHSTWLNDGTRWMWDELGRLAREIKDLRASPPRDNALRERAAHQAARELLLAQSSDWPFLVTTGQAADYAIERFRVHAQRPRPRARLPRPPRRPRPLRVRRLRRERPASPLPRPSPGQPSRRALPGHS